MSMARRVTRLEGVCPPRTPGQIQLVDVRGLPPEEAERQIREAEERAGPWQPGDPPNVIIVDCPALREEAAG